MRILIFLNIVFFFISQKEYNRTYLNHSTTDRYTHARAHVHVHVHTHTSYTKSIMSSKLRACASVPPPVAKIFDVGDIFGSDGKPDTEALMTHFKNEGRVSAGAALRVRGGGERTASFMSRFYWSAIIFPILVVVFHHHSFSHSFFGSLFSL